MTSPDSIPPSTPPQSSSSPAPSPPSSPGLRHLFRDILGFAGSQYFARFATMAKGFVVAKLLGPEGNGLWQHFVLISDYALHSHLGTLPGLNKDLGHRFGEGRPEEIQRVQSTGAGAVLASAILLALAIVAFVIWRGPSLHPVDRLGLPLLGLILIVEQWNFTLQAVLRIHGKIRPISTTTSIFAIANLVLSVALLPWLGIYALLLGWLVTRCGTTWLLHRAGGVTVRPGFQWPVFRRLFAVGFPIFLFHLTRVALRNIDRVLVDQVLSKSELGIYGLAVTLASLAFYLAEAVAFVIYPVYLRVYGETKDPTRLVDQLTRPVEFLAVFLSAALGFSCLVLHLPILALLPEYAACIEIFRLLSISVGLTCLAILPGFYLMAIDRQNLLVPLGVAIVGFEYFAGRAMIDRGGGLPSIALVMSIGALVYAAIVLFISGRFATGSSAKALAWVGRSLLACAVFGGLSAGVLGAENRLTFLPAGEFARAAWGSAAYLLVVAPMLIVYERRVRFLGSFKRRSKSAS